MAHNKKTSPACSIPLPPPPNSTLQTQAFSGWPAISSDISIQICMSKSPQKKCLERKLYFDLKKGKKLSSIET